MTTIVKIDRVTREDIEGAPQSGDCVRITTNNGTVIEQEYTEPSPPPAPAEPKPTAEETIQSRLDTLEAKLDALLAK